MDWFRTHRKFGGRLALFAFAFQLVLSFGHIHLEDIYGNARAFAMTSASAQPADDVSNPLPARSHSHHADDYCAICAIMHLMGSSVAARAPQLPLPLVFASIEHFDRASLVIVATRRAAFQSRAPPQA